MVRVYRGSSLVKTYNVPLEGEGDWWYVFELDGASGEIIDHNTLISASPSAYDSGPGTALGKR